jgi:hypothetical protein
VVAAALAAVVVIVIVVREGSHHRKTAGPNSGSATRVTVVDGGDLGDVPDAAALKAEVEPSIRRGAPSATGGASPSSAAGGSPFGPAATRSSTGPTAPAPSSRVATDPSAIPCEGQARALQPGPQSLVYFAGAKWQGTAAEVLGFSSTPPATTAPGRPPPVRVYVMSRRGCRLLVFQSYAP